MTRVPHIFAFLFGLMLSTILFVGAPQATSYVVDAGEEVESNCDDCEDSCPAETPAGECDDGCAFCSCGASVHVFAPSFLELPQVSPLLIEAREIDGPEQARASGIPPGIFKPPRTQT